MLWLAYSAVPNNCTVHNKCKHDCDFWFLLHKISRLWPFLAHSCHKTNNRTGTSGTTIQTSKYFTSLHFRKGPESLFNRYLCPLLFMTSYLTTILYEVHCRTHPRNSRSGNENEWSQNYASIVCNYCWLCRYALCPGMRKKVAAARKIHHKWHGKK